MILRLLQYCGVRTLTPKAFAHFFSRISFSLIKRYDRPLLRRDNHNYACQPFIGILYLYMNATKTEGPQQPNHQTPPPAFEHQSAIDPADVRQALWVFGRNVESA